MYQNQDSDYYQRRNVLLRKSFFLHQVVEKVRRDIGIPSGSFHEKHEWLLKARGEKLKDSPQFQGVFGKERWGHKSKGRRVKEKVALLDQIEEKIFSKIDNVIEEYSNFGLSHDLIKSAVLGYPAVKDSVVYVVTNPRQLETGVYIKFLPNMSNRDFLQAKESASDAYETLRFLKGEEPPLKINHARRRKSVRLGSDNLLVYEEVEQTYLRLYRNNKSTASLECSFQETAEQLNRGPANIKAVYYRVKNAYDLPSITKAPKVNT